MIARTEAPPTQSSARVLRWLKPVVVVLVSLGALLFPCSAFATQITFSTAKNTALLYTLTAANLASYDPGGTFGIYDDTFCDTGTIATQHGGTADMDGGFPDTIYYTPPNGYVGTDTVTFYNTNNGFICTAQQAIVTVTGAATVSSLSPASGPTAGSTSVTISGTGFTGVTAVKFGSSNAASYTVNSSTQITATSPARSAGTVDVTVVTGGGTSAAVTSDHYTYVAAWLSQLLPCRRPFTRCLMARPSPRRVAPRRSRSRFPADLYRWA